ncbi:FAD-dependent pyridine nucleotide-disulphide oxidoreductase [[Clostridium] ultunense Esp]|nr:FAD-dependent pyridine nucleotide-disulphide oxidoreductase [[Clostridium] ultunense Esp]
MNYDLVAVGGGPAGLAAAIRAKELGVMDILIIERDNELGGILNQCIHNGFGLHIFKKELTGPEYAKIFMDKVEELGIDYKLNTFVLDINDKKELAVVNSTDGFFSIQAKAIILAMGCRERPRGAINIPGTRPSGIFTAGTAQRFINIEGYMVGKKVVILGSGDIGLIMARRLTLEGAKVEAVAEIMPYPNGLKRNIAQCLEDFNIPLLLEHTVIDIIGRGRIEGVILAKVDEDRNVIKGTEKHIECDTLILSVGLIPENELSKSAGVKMDPLTSGPLVDETLETSVAGIFACGNVLHVHDLVDNVTKESYKAGESAAKYIKEVGEKKKIKDNIVHLYPEKGVRYVLPQYLDIDNLDENINLFMRVDNIYKNIEIIVETNGKVIKKFKRNQLFPSEMESILLRKEDLNNMTGNKVSVYIK